MVNHGQTAERGIGDDAGREMTNHETIDHFIDR